MGGGKVERKKERRPLGRRKRLPCFDDSETYGMRAKSGNGAFEKKGGKQEPREPGHGILAEPHLLRALLEAQGLSLRPLWPAGERKVRVFGLIAHRRSARGE